MKFLAALLIDLAAIALVFPAYWTVASLFHLDGAAAVIVAIPFTVVWCNVAWYEFPARTHKLLDLLC